MSLTLNLEPIISAEVEKALAVLKLEEKIDEKLEIAVQKSSKVISVSLGGGEPKKVGVTHKQYETFMKVIALGKNLLIAGDSGIGKSHIIQQIAKSLELPFHAMSVNQQTSKSDLMGFMDANGEYRYNGFITAFKDGGIFLLDEVDAGNANVLTVLNSAISNGFVETPKGEMLMKHENFRVVATANTFGNGANTKFVGRNKLDFATKNRFARVLMTIDEDLELSLIGGDEKLHKGIKAMRKWVEANLDEFSITQRSSIDMKDLMEVLEVEEALNMTFLEGLDEDSQNDLRKIFFKEYGKIPVPKTNASSASVIEPKQVATPTSSSEPTVKNCPECGSDMNVTSDFGWKCEDIFCGHEE